MPAYDIGLFGRATAAVSLQAIQTVVDWLALGLLALILALVGFGILAIRQEIRAAARQQAKAVRLKTTAEQRRQWRQVARSKDLRNLLDDVETLLRVTGADAAEDRKGYRDGVQWVWRKRLIPASSLLLAGVMLAGVLSAVLMVIAQGPANPIP